MTDYSKLTMDEIVRDLAFHYARMDILRTKDKEIREWMKKEYGLSPKAVKSSSPPQNVPPEN